MIKDLNDIQQHLIKLLKAHQSVFKIVQDEPSKFEVNGTLTCMQGKKQVDGIYFASVVPKPKDVRFYFFPLYTHRDQLFDLMSEELKKSLKGKTCFHLKAISEGMAEDLRTLVARAIELYQKDQLLAEV